MTTMSHKRPTTPRPATEEEIEQSAMDKRSTVPFVAQDRIVRRGMYFIARARSHTMAKRIANALNKYTPNEKGE